MNLARHCALCDNQEVNLKEGTRCKLTNRKPEFNTTCFKIELNKKFEDRVKKINIDLENVKRTKIDTYGHLVIFSLASFAVIFGGVYLGGYAWDVGLLSTVPLIILSIGFGLLAFAIGPFNKYRRELALAKDKKIRLDEVLRLYRIEYTIDLEYEKEIHGVKQVKAHLTTKNRP